MLLVDAPKHPPHCWDDDPVINDHLIVRLLSLWELVVPWPLLIERYCLKWFNKPFVLWQRVIILRPSRQPMALQIRPALCTPHFILLPDGCFTARQLWWQKAAGKVVSVVSQRIISRLWEKSSSLSLGAMLSLRGGRRHLLQSAKHVCSIWWLCVNSRVTLLHMQYCKSLPITEHLIATVMYPHYTGILRPSHNQLSWGTGVSGPPPLSSPPSHALSDSPSPILHRWPESSCWPNCCRLIVVSQYGLRIEVWLKSFQLP